MQRPRKSDINRDDDSEMEAEHSHLILLAKYVRKETWLFLNRDDVARSPKNGPVEAR